MRSAGVRRAGHRTVTAHEAGQPLIGFGRKLAARLVKRCLRDVFWFLAAIVLIELIALGKANQWWHVWTTPF